MTINVHWQAANLQNTPEQPAGGLHTARSVIQLNQTVARDVSIWTVDNSEESTVLDRNSFTCLQPQCQHNVIRRLQQELQHALAAQRVD